MHRYSSYIAVSLHAWVGLLKANFQYLFIVDIGLYFKTTGLMTFQYSARVCVCVWVCSLKLP